MLKIIMLFLDWCMRFIERVIGVWVSIINKLYWEYGYIEDKVNQRDLMRDVLREGDLLHPMKKVTYTGGLSSHTANMNNRIFDKDLLSSVSKDGLTAQSLYSGEWGRGISNNKDKIDITSVSLPKHNIDLDINKDRFFEGVTQSLYNDLSNHGLRTIYGSYTTKKEPIKREPYMSDEVPY